MGALRTQGSYMAKRRIAIVRIEVTTPEQWMGDVIALLNDRKGRLDGMEMRELRQVVHALVPLPRLPGFAQDLQVTTGGQATYESRLSHWETTDEDEPDDGAEVPAPFLPAPPTLEAGAEAEPPPDET